VPLHPQPLGALRFFFFFSSLGREIPPPISVSGSFFSVNPVRFPFLELFSSASIHVSQRLLIVFYDPLSHIFFLCLVFMQLFCLVVAPLCIPFFARPKLDFLHPNLSLPSFVFGCPELVSSFVRPRTLEFFRRFLHFCLPSDCWFFSFVPFLFSAANGFRAGLSPSLFFVSSMVCPGLILPHLRRC